MEVNEDGEDAVAAARLAKKLSQKALFDSSHDRMKGRGGMEGDDDEEEGEEGGGGEWNVEGDGGADGAADGGGGGAAPSTSALKPGQELFAEDPYILEVREQQKRQRKLNLDFVDGKIGGAVDEENGRGRKGGGSRDAWDAGKG